MRNDEDLGFYLDRKRAAIAMSQATAEPAIRGIHLAMARRYADLAGTIVSRPTIDDAPVQQTTIARQEER